MVKRVHFLVQGTVQGVNFRYHTQKIAREHNLTGWVKNIPSDKVRGEAQGTDENIDALLRFIKEGPKNARVGKLQTENRPVVEGEEGFEVLRSCAPHDDDKTGGGAPAF